MDRRQGNGISRRSAIRRMGLLMAGAAALGVPSLASCRSAAARRVILYFTATGNSLYVARQLAGEAGELLSIPQLVKAGRYELEADEIGIVYPVYGHMPPATANAILQKSGTRCPARRGALSTTSLR